MSKVINFHKVTNKDWFDRVVCLLKRKYTMISANDIIDYYCNDGKLPRNSCLITVDDGDNTSYDIIYPILKKHQVPAIFFISPEKTMRSGKHRNFWYQEALHCDQGEALMTKIHQGRYTIDEIWDMIDVYKSEHQVKDLPDQNMTLEQVLEIDREGLVAIGAHTMDHPFLARESDNKSQYEIVESIRQLESLLGHPISCFAYPNGIPGEDFGEREMQTLKMTTCKIAFSTKAKDFSKSDNIYAIPRYGLSTGSMTFIRLKLMLGSKYKYLRRFLMWVKGQSLKNL